MEGMSYSDYRITIPKGGGLFLYTDGVPEAMNTSEEYFGMERIEKSLNRYSGSSAREITEGVKRDVDSFGGKADQYDDITMVCVMAEKKG